MTSLLIDMYKEQSIKTNTENIETLMPNHMIYSVEPSLQNIINDISQNHLDYQQLIKQLHYS